MKTRTLLLIAAIPVLPAIAEDDTTVRGVNPADNLTKFEFLPKFTMLDEGSETSITTTTFKYDRAIQGIYGVNMELPLACFDSPAGDESGIGDFNLRGRYQHAFDAFTFVGGLETVLPTATAGEIGHQVGGTFNPGDFFAPPEGFVFSLYTNYYATRALRDGDGNKLNSFDIGGTSVDLDIDVESFQIIPMFIWSPGIKFLGADVSSLVMPVYGQNSIAAELSTISQSSTIGDDT